MKSKELRGFLSRQPDDAAPWCPTPAPTSSRASPAEALCARGLKVWLDEWELIPGQPWREALEEVIETTRCTAVLVGKDGLGPWQDAEMDGCLSEFVKRKLRVIPVLLPA
jgi:hypothetical protein